MGDPYLAVRVRGCQLGIADLLADGPSNSQELALATGSDEPSRIARHPQIRDYQVQQTAAGAAIAMVADASSL